jgi:hypothetical protein
MSPLDILPAYTAIMSLIIWALNEHGKFSNRRSHLNDEERVEGSSSDDSAHLLEDLTPSGHQDTGVHHATSAARLNRPTSRSSVRNTIMTTNNSDITDLSSLRSDSPDAPHRM